MPHFLVVDDHTAVREGLRKVLEAEFPAASVCCAESSEVGLDCLGACACDVIVLDIALRGKDGLAAIRDFKARRPNVKVLVHTMHAESEFGVRALRAGAEGFVTKDAPVAEILRAAHLLLDGRRYVSQSLAELLAGALSSKSDPHAIESLSDREFEILRLITAGYTPTRIAESLSLSIKTVSTYRSRMLEKLDLKTTAELIRFGVEHRLTGPSAAKAA